MADSSDAPKLDTTAHHKNGILTEQSGMNAHPMAFPGPPRGALENRCTAGCFNRSLIWEKCPPAATVGMGAGSGMGGTERVDFAHHSAIVLVPFAKVIGT